MEWLERNRDDLIQPNFRAEPHPPQALVDVYGVHAQMLGPVQHDDRMTGWVSVHSVTERPWTENDIAAIDRARVQVEELIAPQPQKGNHP